MGQSFNGSVVLVTGAGMGIGYGIAAAFARAGSFVALNDLDAALANTAAAAINSAVGAERVSAHPFDVADAAAVRTAISAIADHHGRFDIVIANAGITNFAPFLEMTPSAFDRVLAVNLRGSYFTAQAAAQAMIARGTRHGRILLMASVTGVQAYPNLSAYGVTKAGICHMARVLAVELGRYAITVNALCPGATLTERTQQDDPRYAENWSAVPSGRVGTVEDIVHAALFLAAPTADQITGQTLIIDGGWTVTSPIPPDTPDLPPQSSKLK